ncbi:MAG: MFS transporter, partial [Candidatus Parvarchaeota archaeon]
MGVSLILQLYMTSLGANIFWVGFVSALGSLGTIIFSPLWGSLSDKGGRKRYLMISSLVALIFLFFYPFAPHFLFVVILVFLFSSANAGFVPIATTFASESAERRGIEVGFFNSAL